MSFSWVNFSQWEPTVSRGDILNERRKWLKAGRGPRQAEASKVQPPQVIKDSLSYANYISTSTCVPR